MLKRSILIAAALAAFAGTGAAIAHVSDPTTVTYAFDFESQAVGTKVYEMTGWTGDPALPGYTVELDGDNKVLRGVPSSDGKRWKYAWTSRVAKGQLSLGVEDHDIQVLHIKMKKGKSGIDQFRNWVGVVNPDGYQLAGWYQGGTKYQPQVTASDHSTIFSGKAVDFPDAHWHDFDVVWHTYSGYTEWYVDGVRMESFTNDEFVDSSFGAVQFQSKSKPGDTFYFDDIKVGTTDRIQ